ncbi:SPASM domain-containing protein [Mucilaginibacter achroorhodeus]|uniref:SPASM domain-containing protein n=1 Tax=Mucilaginibacter achroorhodeus TaxID=2599294 RepID=A0A563U620_9SPHI|nr:radical SAM protein [Mucilaginibacter achroorhodeus]TWR26806.1 SPASM domain-containing protein [Mucilaginibacter achroorhodeus]
MKLSKYILSTDPLDEVGLYNKQIIFSTRTATSILVDNSLLGNLAVGNYDGIDSELFETLKQKEFLVPVEQDEFAHVISQNKTAKEQGNFLSMTIQPSANCQLGCHYCGQTHSKHYASDAVIDKYYERIVYLLSQKHYDGLAITWYGGEPLTGYSSIKKASEKFIALANERGMTYISDMVTNGLSLKPKLFTELVEVCKVKTFQITIDGTAESHDQRRITKTGEATFDIIMKNIKDVTSMSIYREQRAQINIRVNIDKTNYQYVDPLIDYVKDNGLQRKVSMYFATIVDFGGNDAGKDSLPKNFFADKEIEWLLKCYENDIFISVMPKRQYSVCMAEKQDSEVYDAFGNIYACWEFPYSETYGSGDSLIGNLFFPKETYNTNATLRNWNEILESGATWCKTCTHLPICGGGCPKSWIEGTPACPPFKSNYKDKLLLDYFIKKKSDEKRLAAEATS